MKVSFGRLVKTVALTCFCALSGMAPVHADEVTISHDGLTLNAVLELADGKALGDGVILMTHGTLAHNNMEIMQALRDMLKERDISTLSINLSLGLDNRHGMYDCATPHTHKHTDAISEINAWVKWLKKQGSGPITLLGHSRGGGQTAMYLNENDDPAITGAVLLAPMTADFANDTKAYEERYKVAFKPLMKRMTDLVKAGKGDAVIADTDFVYCPKTSVSAASFVSYYENQPIRDTPTALKNVSEPVLVIVGTEDDVIPALHSKMESLNLDNVRYETVDGAGHFFRDLYGEDVADLIQEFTGG